MLDVLGLQVYQMACRWASLVCNKSHCCCPARDGTTPGSTPDSTPGFALSQMTPEMACVAAERFGSMSPDELSQMFASGGDAPPSGFAAPSGSPAFVTPQMEDMAAEVMGKMSAEDRAKFQAMAATMQVPPGGGMPQITPEMANMVRRSFVIICLGHVLVVIIHTPSPVYPVSLLLSLLDLCFPQATEMMSKMPEGELRRMQEIASSMGPPVAAAAAAAAPSSSSSASRAVSQPAQPSGFPAVTPDMAKMVRNQNG